MNANRAGREVAVPRRAPTFQAIALVGLAVVSCGRRTPTPAPGLELIRAARPVADPLREPSRISESRPLLRVGGSAAIVETTPLDLGSIRDLFDGNPGTAARTGSASTAVVTVSFVTPRTVSGIVVTTGSMDVGLKVFLTPQGGATPLEFSAEYRNQPPDPTVALDFGRSYEASVLRFEIRSLKGGGGFIHIREIALR